MLDSGSIQLRSGNWHWQVLGGERVRFLHLVREGQPDSQMLRPLVSSAPITPRTVRSFAMHPGSRVWVDAEGEWWMLHDPGYLMRVRPSGPRVLTVVSSAGDQGTVQVTESLELGELNDGELQALVETARASDEEAVRADDDVPGPANDTAAGDVDAT